MTITHLVIAATDVASPITVVSSAMSASSIMVLLTFTAFMIHALLQAYHTPLRDIPGPWLAKFTRLWLLQAYASRSFQNINLDLHRSLGPLIIWIILQGLPII